MSWNAFVLLRPRPVQLQINIFLYQSNNVELTQRHLIPLSLVQTLYFHSWAISDISYSIEYLMKCNGSFSISNIGKGGSFLIS